MKKMKMTLMALMLVIAIITSGIISTAAFANVVTNEEISRLEEEMGFCVINIGELIHDQHINGVDHSDEIERLMLEYSKLSELYAALVLPTDNTYQQDFSGYQVVNKTCNHNYTSILDFNAAGPTDSCCYIVIATLNTVCEKCGNAKSLSEHKYSVFHDFEYFINPRTYDYDKICRMCGF